MADQGTSSASSSSLVSRSRGRGRSRGGVGKYLRARGRRGAGRPAEFGQRLVLEGEVSDDPESEEAEEARRKFSKRQLVSNADRYAEPEPELNSDGEAQLEPEVDLSAFLERQRLSDHPFGDTPDVDEDDIDTTLVHISSDARHKDQNKKGRVQRIEWDESLDMLQREKAAAEAAWDLKARFRAKDAKVRSKPADQGTARERKQERVDVLPPPLPADMQETKDPKGEMEDFLDDLLS